MGQESSDKLQGVQCHMPGSSPSAVVFVGKPNLSFIKGFDPVVGNSYAVGIATQVFNEALMVYCQRPW